MLLGVSMISPCWVSPHGRGYQHALHKRTSFFDNTHWKGCRDVKPIDPAAPLLSMSLPWCILSHFPPLDDQTDGINDYGIGNDHDNYGKVDYLNKPLEVFREIRRVLRPGGKAIMSMSNR